MRRVCSSGWWRRWRGLVWCITCVVCLAILAIWDTLGYLLASSDDQSRTRHCPPPPVEVDGCATWRPLVVLHPTCICNRKLLVLHDTCTDFVATDPSSYITYTMEYYGNSECSDQATLRGPRQHVVSLSIDQMTSYDLATLNQTINQVNSAYKGWVVRVYAPTETHNHPGLCSLVCANPNLDLCDVKHMVHPPTTVYPQGRTGWRWAVLGDPLVSVWLVRYQEMEVLAREAHAVTQFINSDKCWHLMKDHPSHAKSATGSGLLGGKTSWGSNELHHIRYQLTHEIQSISDEETLLEDILLPLMGHDVMTHDSITCQQTLESVPYPSRRNPGQWVGMPSTNLQQEKLTLKSPNRNTVPKQMLNVTDKPMLLLKKIAKNPYTTLTKPKSKIPISTESPKDHQVTNKEHKSKYDHKMPHNSDPHTTKASKKEQKVPQKMKDNWRHQDFTKEKEINREKGIDKCPPSCRPHLHPDWQYC